MNINHINKSLGVLSNIKKYKGVLSPECLQTTTLYQSQSLKSILHILTLKYKSAHVIPAQNTSIKCTSTGEWINCHILIQWNIGK